MIKEASKAAKLEENFGIMVGGYQDHSKKLTECLTGAFDSGALLISSNVTCYNIYLVSSKTRNNVLHS